MSNATQAKQHWIQIVQRQRSSGLGVAEFCRRHGVAASSFFAWRSRLGDFVAAGDSRAPAFVEVTTMRESAPDASGVEVHLGNGRRIGVGRCFDPGTLCRVVLALERMPKAQEGAAA